MARGKPRSLLVTPVVPACPFPHSLCAILLVCDTPVPDTGVCRKKEKKEAEQVMLGKLVRTEK